jgi:hypothetical protein
MIDESLGPHCRWTDTDSGTEYKVQVAFQVRIRPGTYSIGQHTLAEGRTRTFDETGTYSNNEVGPGHLYFMGVAGVSTGHCGRGTRTSLAHTATVGTHPYLFRQSMVFLVTWLEQAPTDVQR